MVGDGDPMRGRNCHEELAPVIKIMAVTKNVSIFGLVPVHQLGFGDEERMDSYFDLCAQKADSEEHALSGS